MPATRSVPACLMRTSDLRLPHGWKPWKAPRKGPPPPPSDLYTLAYEYFTGRLQGDAVPTKVKEVAYGSVLWKEFGISLTEMAKMPVSTVEDILQIQSARAAAQEDNKPKPPPGKSGGKKIQRETLLKM